MTSKTVAIAGLPSSGKTTYLAAFWYLLSSAKGATQVTYDSVLGIKTEYLDDITNRWLDGIRQKRSVEHSGPYVDLKLVKESTQMVLTFPDLSGEVYRDMWELRQFPEGAAVAFQNCSGLLFFIDGDNAQKAPLLCEVKKLREKMKEKDGDYIPYHPNTANLQTKIVDLLQSFCSNPISMVSRNLSIIISCWDKVDPDRTPEQFLSEKLPLLAQYLDSGADGWNVKTFGISAQGTDYDNDPEDKASPRLTARKLKKLDQIRNLDAVERISVVHGTSKSHDLSEPFAWFLS